MCIFWYSSTRRQHAVTNAIAGCTLLLIGSTGDWVAEGRFGRASPSIIWYVAPINSRICNATSPAMALQRIYHRQTISTGVAQTKHSNTTLRRREHSGTTLRRRKHSGTTLRRREMNIHIAALPSASQLATSTPIRRCKQRQHTTAERRATIYQTAPCLQCNRNLALDGQFTIPRFCQRSYVELWGYGPPKSRMRFHV